MHVVVRGPPGVHVGEEAAKGPPDCCKDGLVGVEEVHGNEGEADLGQEPGLAVVELGTDREDGVDADGEECVHWADVVEHVADHG